MSALIKDILKKRKKRDSSDEISSAPDDDDSTSEGKGQPLYEEASMEILGIDIGFGFTKATTGDKSMIFKSVLGESIKIQSSDAVFADMDDLEYLHADVDGKDYFLGELAVRQSSERFFTLDQSQFVSHYTKVLALTAAAKLVKSHIPINLVTGLPIGFYSRHKKELVKILLGEHAVILKDAEGNTQEKTVNINKVSVMFQPWGSLFNVMLNERGELKDKRPVSEKYGIIDVGFRTSDYSVSDKMHYSERGSRTTDSGIARAFNLLATGLREQSGVNVELYRLYDAVDKGRIKIRGEEYNIEEQTREIFSQLATKVANEADRLWVDDWDIDNMIVTGGGGRVLSKYLEPLIKGHVTPMDTDIDARFNNVHGYWKFGRNMWAKGS
ncbi:MAG: ParM/StbA family protein [Deltaproteobacteria bacterium]|nr:ParM/StbA family protein [Deltaproteobacteria bacterium]